MSVTKIHLEQSINCAVLHWKTRALKAEVALSAMVRPINASKPSEKDESGLMVKLLEKTKGEEL